MYPTRNPFIPQATLSLDGMEGYTLTDIPTSTSRVPLERLDSIRRRYLEGWQQAGRAVALHGDHGTGKTHTVLYALAQMSTATTSGDRSPVVLYVRADVRDPLTLYRKLMTRVTLTVLTDLVREAYASFAAEEFVGSRREPSHELDTERLRKDPALAAEAVKAGELSGTAIVDRIENDIKRIQGGYGNFERALRALTNPERAATAHKWLTGGHVSPEDLERLGVRKNLEEVPELRTGIQVIATLARHAGRPMTVAVDQVEALLVKSDRTIDADNAGLVRSVLEAVVKEHGLFIAAMSEYSWTEMPEDVRQRFGPSEIQLRQLSLLEAEDMLRAYLAPWPPDAGESPIHPFTPDGMRQLLVESGGNLRRFIQLGHAVFSTTTAGQIIDGKTVTRALAAAGGERAPTEAEVRRAVERTLRGSGHAFRAMHAVDGQVIDYVVVQGDSVLLAVEISRAVFGTDEASQAVAQVEKIKALRRHQPSIVLLVVGYSSPEVIEKLEEAAGQVIVAASTGFENEFEAAVRDAARTSEGAAAAALDVRLDRLREELVALAHQRRGEEELVSQRLEQATAKRSRTEWQDQLRAYRITWAQERQRIEDEIAHRRGQQRRTDIDQLVAEHDAAVQRRRARRRDLVLRIALAASGFAATASIGVAFASDRLLGVMIFLVSIPLIGAAAAYFVFVREEEFKPSPPIDSIEDLNRIARHRGFPDPYGEDPYDRLAASLGRHSDRLAEIPARSSDESTRGPVALAAAEPVRILRRRLAAEAVSQSAYAIEAALDEELDPATLSVMIERAKTDDDGSWVERLPERLVLLAQLRGVRPVSRGLIQDFLAAVEGGMEAGPPVPLAQAFLTDDDGRLAAALSQLPERELRRAIAVFSPLDNDGLGTYYWLKRIDFIDELYLFFRKAAFFSGAGLEAPDADAPVAVPRP